MSKLIKAKDLKPGMKVLVYDEVAVVHSVIHNIMELTVIFEDGQAVELTSNDKIEIDETESV